VTSTKNVPTALSRFQQRSLGSDRPSTNFPYTLRMIQTIKAITNSVPSSPYPNMIASYESLRDRNIVGQRKLRVCVLSHVMTRLASSHLDLVGAECPQNRFLYLFDPLCATVPSLRVRLKWRFCVVASLRHARSPGARHWGFRRFVGPWRPF
jgi:hypothetical protein